LPMQCNPQALRSRAGGVPGSLQERVTKGCASAGTGSDWQIQPALFTHLTSLTRSTCGCTAGTWEPSPPEDYKNRAHGNRVQYRSCDVKGQCTSATDEALISAAPAGSGMLCVRQREPAGMSAESESLKDSTHGHTAQTDAHSPVSLSCHKAHLQKYSWPAHTDMPPP
jgi:hypothetical protein